MLKDILQLAGTACHAYNKVHQSRCGCAVNAVCRLYEPHYSNKIVGQELTGLHA